MTQSYRPKPGRAWRLSYRRQKPFTPHALCAEPGAFLFGSAFYKSVAHPCRTGEVLVPMSVNDMRVYGSIAVAREVGISLRQLYYWVDVLHAVNPQVRQHGRRTFRRFTEVDLRRLKDMRRLVQRGYTLQAAVGMTRSRWTPAWRG